MSSLPQQPSQRPPSSRHDSSSQSEPPSQVDQDSNEIAQSTATLDSQTILINRPENSSHDSQQASPQIPTPQETTTESQVPQQEEPRRCWICFSDETEDTSTTSEWKSPCPCALTAHEACLLDWIADIEAPTTLSRNRENRSSGKIQCPQCKTDIKVARPRSLIVSSTVAIDRSMAQLLWPGAVAVLGSGVLGALFFHGTASVLVIFGKRDFQRLLTVNPGEVLSPRWAAGLPMIPLVLVLSRTSFADGFLPALPLVFFAAHIPDIPQYPGSFWPPSAAMTFSTLPYLRAVYNKTYKYLFAKKERQWIRELMPQRDIAEEGNVDVNEQQDHAHEHDHEHDHDHQHNNEHEHQHGHVHNIEMNVEIDLEVVGNQEGEGDDERQIEEARRIWDEAVVRVDEEGNPLFVGQRAGQQGRRQQNRGGDDGVHDHQDFVLNANRLAHDVLGALAFPVVAATAGELLRMALPKFMTTAIQKQGTRPGLLQTRWGRSVIGGCLFVVLKDAMVLYSRYLLTKSQRERKIVDWKERQHRRPGGVGRGSQT